ncbi:MAG: YCF48-related protein [Ignavibacteria bacterium]
MEMVPFIIFSFFLQSLFFLQKKFYIWASLFFITLIYPDPVNLFGQSEWIKQYSGTTDDLWGVYCTDTLTAIAVGANGTIIRTTNGGVKWNRQKSHTSVLLYGVTFVTRNRGFIVGSKGTILQTENGGETWVSKPSGTNIDLHSVSFADENTGMAVGGEGTSALILRTEDSGLTWFLQTIPINIPLWGVSLINKDTGFVVGEWKPGGTIFCTTDGGVNWNPQSAGYYTDKMYNIDFINENTGMAVGLFGTVIITNNGGQTWFNLEVPRAEYFDVAFIDKENIIVVGDKIISSTDGGVNWSEHSKFSYSPLLSVSALDKLHAIAVGEKGTILSVGSAVNEHQDWVEINLPDEKKIRTVICSNEKIYAGTADGVFVSTDYGCFWNQINTGLLNENIVGLTGSDSTIFVITQDENNKIEVYFLIGPGCMWKKINIPSTISSSYWLKLSTMDSIFLMAHDYNLWNSTDKGQTWENLIKGPYATIDVLKYLKEIDRLFISFSEGWHDKDLTGHYVSTLYSADKGETWNTIEDLSHGWLIDEIKYVSENKLLALGPWKGMLASSDSGSTWISADNELKAKSITSVTNYDTILIASVDSEIYISRDEGVHWILYVSNIGSALSFVNGDYGFSFSRYSGTLFRIPIELLTDTAYQNQDQEPEQEPGNENNFRYFLKQNYPNPFNSSTIITYEIPYPRLVTLKIYDVLGREIETLVNEEKTPGRYKAEFNGSNLSSGIYFYRITVGSFSETKKMILMK